MILPSETAVPAESAAETPAETAAPLAVAAEAPKETKVSDSY